MLLALAALSGTARASAAPGVSDSAQAPRDKPVVLVLGSAGFIGKYLVQRLELEVSWVEVLWLGQS